MNTETTQPAARSAPKRLRTFDGAEWKLHATTQTGISLYALADAPACCPPFVMATLEELAAHGIQTREPAAAVTELGGPPMPTSNAPQAPTARAAEPEAETAQLRNQVAAELEQLRNDITGACLGLNTKTSKDM